jgi:KipI family sensor histidine kinase inhibitor
VRLLPCGPDAVLIEVGSAGEVAAARAAVVAAALPSVIDVVPAARTVLVRWRRGHADVAALTPLVNDLTGDGGEVPPPARTVVVPVSYDGPDLELVASTAGVDVGEVVALHSGATYTVAFCGFAPGFAYLTGLPDVLRQARLDSPRARVPAGSVGVAGPYTGVYPRPTPGGWRLIGSTTTVLFDATRSRPALLEPGDRVRFRPVSP